MYHVKSGAKIDSVDLSTPLTYADRFRIRHPGVQWDAHPPHVDGQFTQHVVPKLGRLMQTILNRWCY